MSVSALQRRAREARCWLLDSCFPLWADHGVNEAGLFPESLTTSLDEAPAEYTRVRVQARQTYVFSEAWRLGWKRDTAAKLVNAGVATLAGRALNAQGLAGRTLSTSSGHLVDVTSDLYDTAFVLFSLAEAARGPGPAEPAMAAAQGILMNLEKSARDAAQGGYAETLPPPAHRQQNPHMHLLEACLALHAVQPDGGHMARAQELIDLFETKLTAGPNGLLGEHFAPDWSPLPGDPGRIVEPGHQFEWVWLLHAYARQAGEPVSPAAERLYTFALTTLDVEGRAILSAARGGAPIDASRRAWPQTEALKAHLAMLEARRDDRYAAAACRSFDILMDEHLTEDGGWIDHIGADGAVVSNAIPASTGYHVVLAFAELIRVMNA
ncbi:N-acylglucosamine 2-epimerase [Hyphomonas neptunium ATCC 15444]|uniref:N-acylglucosamine 2-epimerase n=2 Tax=Hyphomonas TaxID=85 RepID=Q0C677_HYPNA|nr:MULTISPECIES: AGE family epimerase/isomerase [Hyphomonas]ABI78402.1 N-acylglucosamine 2-epimerase [Hyphomonas neptunium ATCC 15444]KCZ94846.1 N-acylglucosamine 2-epimerase [Hyphomonas hirschiana VP5]